MLAMRARTHTTDIVKTYHYLVLGELILAGDECYNASTGKWEKTVSAGSNVYPLEVGNYRREIK